MKYKALLDKSKEEFSENKKFFQKLKKTNHRTLDQAFHEQHEKVFKSIDCLSCANCCKTTSPIFRDVDIKRIAKRFRVSEAKFIDCYLRVDEDNDYVLQTAPCPFLDLSDNKCTIYEDRPLACREYPHTNRKNMYQILDLTLKNAEICPAVSQIVTNLKDKI
jgi:uncharacterized protein